MIPTGSSLSHPSGAHMEQAVNISSGKEFLYAVYHGISTVTRRTTE